MAPRLILIPGLGVGKRLFDPQRRQFSEIMFVPDWQRPLQMEIEGKKRWESLEQYASRWADRWMQTVLKDDESRSNFVLGGESFGGMVAMEAARHLVSQGVKPRSVLLISSACSADALSRVPFLAGRLMSRLLPEKQMKKMIRKIGQFAARKGGVSELDQVMVRKLLKAIDMEIVRFGLDAMSRWNLNDHDAGELVRAGVPVHQIHGSKDRALKRPKGYSGKTIAGGGHLINITHAQEINEFIQSALEEAIH